MARDQQLAQVAPPSKTDMDALLKDYSAVIQRNFEEVYDILHSHQVVTSVPDSNAGNVQDIYLYDDNTNQYLYVKFPSGWKRFIPA